MEESRWLRNFFDHFSCTPRDYVVIDIETTGVDLAVDLIVQVGQCVVEAGRAVSNFCVLLDWTKSAAVDQLWLKARLDETRRKMEIGPDGQSTGRVFKCNYDDMSSGVEPISALRSIFELIELQKRTFPFVAHNGIAFDTAMLCHHARRWTGHDLVFGENSVWDTGAIEKALQIGMFPEPGDTLKSFFLRVNCTRARGVRWNLDRHCVGRYQLDTRYGLDMAQAHSAGFDARLGHLLFEEYYSLSRKAS